MKGIDRMKLHRTWVLVVCTWGLASGLPSTLPRNAFAQVRPESIRDDWPSYNGDYTGRRFSSLIQITPQNAGHLQAQWVFHTKTPGVLEATPRQNVTLTILDPSSETYFWVLRARSCRTGH